MGTCHRGKFFFSTFLPPGMSRSRHHPETRWRIRRAAALRHNDGTFVELPSCPRPDDSRNLQSLAIEHYELLILRRRFCGNLHPGSYAVIAIS